MLVVPLPGSSKTSDRFTIRAGGPWPPTTVPVGGAVGCPWALFADGSDPSGVVPCGVVAVVVVVCRPSEFWSDEPLCAVPMPLPALPTLLPGCRGRRGRAGRCTRIRRITCRVPDRLVRGNAGKRRMAGRACRRMRRERDGDERDFESLRRRRRGVLLFISDLGGDVTIWVACDCRRRCTPRPRYDFRPC